MITDDMNRTVIVDIDNVLAKTDEMVRKIILDRMGIPSKQFQITDWSYSTSLGFPKEEEKSIFDELHNRCLLDIDPVDGAALGMKEISKWWNIIYATARPESTRDITAAWLIRHDFPPGKLLFPESKISISDQANLIIEDNAVTAELFARNNKHVFLLDYPWNQGDPPSFSLITRVFSWNNIINIMEGRLWL